MVALTCAMMSLMQIHDRLDRCDRSVQPLGFFAIGGFKSSRTGRFNVERRSQTRAVHAQRLHLRRETFFVAISLLAPFDRGIKRVERERQTLDRGIDCAFLAHGPTRTKTLVAADI